jgi:hypothetical protein
MKTAAVLLCALLVPACRDDSLKILVALKNQKEQAKAGDTEVDRDEELRSRGYGILVENAAQWKSIIITHRGVIAKSRRLIVDSEKAIVEAEAHLAAAEKAKRKALKAP